MGRTGKWLKSFIYGRKDKGKGGSQIPAAADEINRSATAPSPASKEKNRWSFRRSAGGAGRELTTCAEPACIAPLHRSEAVSEQKQHAIALQVATEAEAVAFQLSKCGSSTIEASAATKIQAVFRSYLARKALRALKGLVKLQALVRGHLVRKQATTALRCMQALLTVQARARAQRIRMVEDPHTTPRRKSTHRGLSSPQDPRYRGSHEIETNMDENVKIVEIDLGEWKGNSKSGKNNCRERTDPRFYLYNGHVSKYHQQVSPVPSAITDMSPRACSSHLEEFSFNTVDSSPHCHSSISQPYPPKQVCFTSRQEDTCYPNYMANTESSRAKARSQSAPRQRPDTCERQPSRRKLPIEGVRNSIPRIRMQRSSSQQNGYHYPWPIKLDRSNMSLNDSECGSSSTVLTNSIYCRSVEGYEVGHHKPADVRSRYTIPSRTSY